MSFAQSVARGRVAAVQQFIEDTTMTRERWESMEWNDWHLQPELIHLGLVPLGGQLRFGGTEQQAIDFRFKNTRVGELLGATIERNPEQSWHGIAADVNDAARDAITTLLEMAYLRAVQRGPSGKPLVG